jgi:hypothetical protein
MDGKKLYESMDTVYEALPEEARPDFVAITQAQTKWTANTAYLNTMRRWLKVHGFR